MFDATFWVAISFLLFVLLLIYKKVPTLILQQIDNKISELKNKLEEAEKLKSTSEKLLSEAQIKIEKSNEEGAIILKKAQKISDEEISVAIEKMKISLANKEKSAENKIEQAKNDAIKQVTKLATQVALETVEKIIIENLENKQQEEINIAKLKQSVDKIKNIN
jgi:F-type H+-transporting ATPase subunit b